MKRKAIALENVMFSYTRGSGKPALEGVNLEIDEGEFVAIIGPIDAGKTTLCRLLNGLVPHHFPGQMSGDVYIFGLNTREQTISNLSRVVGMVFPDPESQLIATTVKEEVAFGPENYGLPEEEVEERVKEALRIVGMEGFEERHPYSLSGGQKQRVGIASILSMKPAILVLDEPTSELDPIGTSEVFSVIKRLNESLSITIVLVSQKFEHVAEYANRLIVLNEGKIVAQGSPREILTNVDLLRKVKLRPPQVTEFFHELRLKGFQIQGLPMTLEEACSLSMKLFKFPSVTRTPIKEYRTDKRKIIEVKDLWHVYEGKVEALRGVNLDIYEEEFVAVIGQNGSGKTTLVKHFNGLLKPTEGTVIVDGTDTRKATVAQLARRVGYVFQNPDHQIFEEYVEDELKFGLRNLDISEEEVEHQVSHVIKLLNLEAYRQAYPRFLSTGLKKRVNVASIVAMRPKILVLDEPTTGQDYIGARHIADVGKMLNKMGYTIIMITHDMMLVAEFAERTIVMSDGKVVLDGPTREVFTHIDTLTKIGIRPPQIIQFALRLRQPNVLTVEEFLEGVNLGSVS